MTQYESFKLYMDEFKAAEGAEEVVAAYRRHKERQGLGEEWLRQCNEARREAEHREVLRRAERIRQGCAK